MNEFLNYKRTASLGIIFLILFFIFLLISQAILAQNSVLNFENATGNEYIANNDTFVIRSEIIDFEGTKCWQVNDEEGNFGSLEIKTGSFIPVSFQIRRPWGKFDVIITGFNKKNKVLTKKITVSDTFQKVTFKAQEITRITVESLKKYNQVYIDNFEYQIINSDKKKNISDVLDDLEAFRLSFESNRLEFIENNHPFTISSSVSGSFSSDSLKSWECAQDDGTTGILEIKRGKFTVKSLKIKRPWGKFKTKITGWDEDKKVFTKTIRVNNEFSKFVLPSKKITRLQIESSKKYNQLYVDEVAYWFHSDSMESPIIEKNRVENNAEKNENENLQVNLDSLNNTNFVKPIVLLDKPYQIRTDYLTVDFENIVLEATDFQSNGHFFRLQSQVFEGHARSGKNAWLANENDGTSGVLKMDENKFDLFSIWAKRPWGKFDALISAYENGVKKYEKIISINSDYQRITFNNWRKIDELRITSTKKYNQVYLDDISYGIHVGENIVQVIDNEPKKQGEDTTIEEIFAENPTSIIDLMRGENEVETKNEMTYEIKALKIELPEGQIDLAPEIFEFGNRYFGQRFKLAEATVMGTKLAWEILDGSAQMIGTNEIELTGTDSVRLQVSDESGNSWRTKFKVSKAEQIMQIDPIPNVTVDDEAAEIMATLTSGLVPKVEILEGPAEVYGDAVILKKIPGKVRLKIYHPGNEFYNPVEAVEKSFYVGRKSQNITFAQIEHELDGSPFKIRAVSSSGLPVEMEVISGNAELEDNIITPQKIDGSTEKSCIIIKAYQAGNSEYEPAPQVQKRFYINNKTTDYQDNKKKDNTKSVEIEGIEYQKSEPSKMGNAPSDIYLTNNLVKDNARKNTIVGKLSARDDDMKDVHYFELLDDANGLFKVNEKNELILAKSKLNANQEPLHIITVKVFDNQENSYEKQFDILVKDGKSLAFQKITMSDFEDKVFNAPNFKVQAVSSVGQPVKLLVEGAAELLDDQMIQLMGVGEVRITATAKGNNDYAPASMTRVFYSKKAPQSVVIHDLGTITIDSPPIPLKVSTSSGLAADYEVDGVARIEDNQLILSGEEGKITIRAHQKGTELYEPAEATLTFEVGRKKQGIYFSAIEGKTFGDMPFELNANTNSGLPVGFEVLSGNAEIQGDKVVLKGAGWVRIKAYQDGNGIYAPAEPVIREFNVKSAINITSSLRPKIRRGERLQVQVSVQGQFSEGNQFRLVLSDTHGNFEHNTQILSTIGNHERFFDVEIPQDIPVGTNYRLRVESTEPQLFSSPSETGMVIAFSHERNMENHSSHAIVHEQNRGESMAVPDEEILNVTPSNKQGRYTVELNKYDIKNLEIIILNHSGDTIFESYYSKIAGYRERVNLSEVPAGSYKVRVVADEQIYVKNFEVKN